MADGRWLSGENRLPVRGAMIGHPEGPLHDLDLRRVVAGDVRQPRRPTGRVDDPVLEPELIDVGMTSER